MAKQIMEKRTRRKRVPSAALAVERLASDTPQKTPKDNLTLDALDAERAGMSYGKYKALHPQTRDANEHRLAEKPKRPPRTRQIYENICLQCGRTFSTTNHSRLYCDDKCNS